MTEVPNDYIRVNENPLAHNEEIEDEVEFQNAEEVENEERGQVEAIKIPLPLILYQLNRSCHF